MDPKNKANPAAPNDEQNTSPQADAQQDAMPSLGDETVQGTDVGNGSPAPDTSAGESVDVSGDGTPAERPAAPPPETFPEASSGPPEVALGADSTDPQPSITPEAPVPASEDTTLATPPEPTPAPDAGVPVDTSTPSTLPADQQAASSEPVPPVAPTPTASNDKRTIVVLGVVAVVLLVAIAALYLFA